MGPTQSSAGLRRLRPCFPRARDAGNFSWGAKIIGLEGKVIRPAINRHLPKTTFSTARATTSASMLNGMIHKGKYAIDLSASVWTTW
jgi:hypothetical protein